MVGTSIVQTQHQTTTPTQQQHNLSKKRAISQVQKIKIWAIFLGPLKENPISLFGPRNGSWSQLEIMLFPTDNATLEDIPVTWYVN